MKIREWIGVAILGLTLISIPACAKREIDRDVRSNKITMNEWLLSVGVKPSDKVISINGRPLTDFKADEVLIDELFKAGSFQIVFERGSRRITINHSF